MSLDATIAYRSYVAELQHGRRGALARAARTHQVSAEWMRQLVKRHEQEHPVCLTHCAPPGAHEDRNTAEAPVASPRPAQQATESLEYVPPPGAYAHPEPRNIPQYPAPLIHHNPQPIHILSTTSASATPEPQVFAFRRDVPGPNASARAAANLSYGVAVVLTVLLVWAMCRDARLLVFLPFLLVVWAWAGSCQRAMFGRR